MTAPLEPCHSSRLRFARGLFAALRVTWISLVFGVFCLLLLTGCTDALSDDDDPSGDAESSLLPMTLTAWLFPPQTPPATGEPAGVAHLSIAPMQPGDNGIVVHLSDLDGNPLPLAGDDATLELTYRALEPDAQPETIRPSRSDNHAATWAVDALPLPGQGWYAIDLTLLEATTELATGTVYTLLPDPSVYGAEALDLPDSDPDAEALYEQALAAYGSWETGSWRESLGSGTDVLVVTDYTVVAPDPGQAAMSTHSRYSGSFREKPDGTAPGPPRRDFAERIVIGERSWSREAGGVWTETGSLGASGFAERADIYTGATNIRPGGTGTIDGVETQIITFYLPRKGGQAEAWFAWWVEPETGNPLRMAMIAEMHFMVWDFHDINESLDITPPPADHIATPVG